MEAEGQAKGFIHDSVGSGVLLMTLENSILIKA